MSTKELKPAAYMYERLMHDYLGGWESHITTFDPRESQWAKPEDLRNVEPLYSADTIERLERERDEAAAQIVSAREECPLVRRQDYFGTPLPALVAAQVSELFGWQSRAEAAESELTTLRSRVARLEEAAWFVRDHLAYALAGPFGTAGEARAIAKIDAALTEEQP